VNELEFLIRVRVSKVSEDESGEKRLEFREVIYDGDGVLTPRPGRRGWYECQGPDANISCWGRRRQYWYGCPTVGAAVHSSPSSTLFI
jgi:hypothetical protein